VAVKIKLKRLGKIREPYYRIVVADARTKRDGRAIEEIGKYHPKADPSVIEVDSERVQHWLSVGAQPTDPVRHLLTITGDWQKFKGEPGAEGTLKTAEPKADKKERYESLAKESQAAKETKAPARPARSSAKKEQPKKAEPAEAAAPAETKAETKAEPAKTKAEAKAEAKAEPAEAAAPAETEAETKAEPKVEPAETKAEADASPAPEAAAEAPDGGSGA
jgi:small subunit ribosomal protein S16